MAHKIAGQIVLTECNKIFTQNNNFSDCHEYITKLSQNIKKYGVLEPLMIRPVNYGMYEIISGKKRFKATKLAGFTSVPCIITEVDEKTGACINFIKNQFINKNNFFDESKAVKSLILDYKYNIDEVADMLSVDIFEIINRLKILNFSHENIIKIKNSKLSFNQCVMLTKLEDTELLNKTLDEIIKNNLNDNQTKELVDKTIKSNKNSVILNNTKILTNTIENAVDKIKNYGVNITSIKKSDDEKIEYLISIDVKSQNK